MSADFSPEELSRFFEEDMKCRPIKRDTYRRLEGTDGFTTELSHIEDFNDLIDFAIDSGDWQYAKSLIKRKQTFLNERSEVK